MPHSKTSSVVIYGSPPSTKFLEPVPLTS
ncbi:hypothetical protein Goari_020187 [Gossypium aridum]|uniref:Uncharacterized protein n=1 Tax=Gossypium aridum TaxID=34290 RepID=A0A7J8WUZ4_GOSAI|nr:hypothetical protein [Gossypium aridum]